MARGACKHVALGLPVRSEMRSPCTVPSTESLLSITDGTKTNAIAPSATNRATTVGHAILSLLRMRPRTAAQSGFTAINMSARAEVVCSKERGNNTLTAPCNSEATAMCHGASVKPRQSSRQLFPKLNEMKITRK
eukprot:scaffold206878_cov37-Tisochrysis_lutea.AAC.2